jgi:hypothetical protein
MNVYVFIHAYEYYNYGTRRARMRIENVEKLGSVELCWKMDVHVRM